MLRDPEFFGDREMILVYVAKRLREARAVEQTLDAGGLDYAVQPEHYTGGVFFTSRRVGAFFYVTPENEDEARFLLRASGYRPSNKP
jgi:hypothetical protein